MIVDYIGFPIIGLMQGDTGSLDSISFVQSEGPYLS